MGDPIKISTEELQEFNVLKAEIQKNIFQFGELYLEKMRLDNLYESLSQKEKELRNVTIDLKKRESDLMDKILKKYGEGNLNIATGTFTAS